MDVFIKDRMNNRIEGEVSMKQGIIDKRLIGLDIEVKDGEEFLDQISERLIELGFVKDSFKEAIKEREREYPTALPTEPYALAIPHADPEHVKKPFIAFTRLKNPIAWKAMGMKDLEIPVSFLFVLGFFAEEDNVELLRRILEQFQEEEFLEQLKEITDEEECMNLFCPIFE